MKTLLLLAPLTQIGSPYPATTALKGYLVQQGHDCYQADLGIELINKIYTKEFLGQIFTMAFEKDRLSTLAKNLAMKKSEVLGSIDIVRGFLQGQDPSLAQRIVARTLLPNIGRVKRATDADLEWAFGVSGTIDRAKHLVTLYFEDLADFIAEVASPGFALVRYMEQIALSLPSFAPMAEQLQRESDPVESLMLELFEQKIIEQSPQLVAISVPFPGTLASALRMGKHIKSNHPNITVAIGGGYVNTELRQISETAIFDYVDYIMYDDGELPITSLISHLNGEIAKDQIVRAKYLDQGSVVDSKVWEGKISEDDKPTPDFSDLRLDMYMSTIEGTNPMHKLWSDGRWNKLTVAHGCYWAGCSFCDTKLDYINRYDAPKAKTVVDRMEAIVKQTGSRGFHFTDEALPPKLLKEIASEICERGLIVSYWGNIRFEKQFDSELTKLLASSGCIAVSGGLEVASPRILKLINKGVTIEQAAHAMAAFNEAGIMVHAYLMYGFPTQTFAESVDSLEIVRQMFAEGLVQSAFWHRFAMTEHSEVGCNPTKYSVTREGQTNSFANNALNFSSESTVDWDEVGGALSLATSNFMTGLGYDTPLKRWFKEGVTVRQSVAKNFISKLFEE